MNTQLSCADLRGRRHWYLWQLVESSNIFTIFFYFHFCPDFNENSTANINHRAFNMLNKIKAKLKTREHAKAPEILSHIWTEALFWVSRAKLIPRTGHKLMIQTLRWVLICLSCWKSTPSACVRLLALHFQFLNFCTWCSRNSCIEMGDCVAKLLCGKTGMMENVIFLQLQMSPGWGSVWPDVRSFWNLPWHLGSIRAIRSSWPGTISSGGETSGVKHKQNQKSIHPLCEQKVQIPCLGKHFNCGYVVILTTSR